MNYLVGSILIFSGTILLGIMHLAIANYIPSLQGWSDPPGKLTTVLTEIRGWFPYGLSLVLLLVGTIMIIDYFQKTREKE